MDDCFGPARFTHYWCEKMIERYREEKAGKLILLGDILYHGPRNDLPRDYAPKKVIEMLNGMKEELLCIRGNCDCDVDQMVLQFPIMADLCGAVAGRARWCGRRHGHVFNMDNHPPLQNRRHPAARSHPHPGSTAVLARDFTTSTRARCPIPQNGSKNSYLILQDSTFHPQMGGGWLYHQQLHRRIRGQKRRTEAGTSFLIKERTGKERFLSSGNGSLAVLFLISSPMVAGVQPAALDSSVSTCMVASQPSPMSTSTSSKMRLRSGEEILTMMTSPLETFAFSASAALMCR